MDWCSSQGLFLPHPCFSRIGSRCTANLKSIKQWLKNDAWTELNGILSLSTALSFSQWSEEGMDNATWELHQNKHPLFSEFHICSVDKMKIHTICFSQSSLCCMKSNLCCMKFVQCLTFFFFVDLIFSEESNLKSVRPVWWSISNNFNLQYLTWLSRAFGFTQTPPPAGSFDSINCTFPWFLIKHGHITLTFSGHYWFMPHRYIYHFKDLV